MVTAEMRLEEGAKTSPVIAGANAVERLDRIIRTSPQNDRLLISGRTRWSTRDRCSDVDPGNCQSRKGPQSIARRRTRQEEEGVRRAGCANPVGLFAWLAEEQAGPGNTLRLQLRVEPADEDFDPPSQSRLRYAASSRLSLKRHV